MNAFAPLDTPPSSTDLPVTAGQSWRFGRYQVLEEISRGGAGVVFRARDEALRRDVALKFLHAGRLASRDDIRRLFLEARAAARLNHPSIVPVFEIGGADDAQPFLAMAFLPGGTLAQRLKQGAVSPSDAARWLAAVALAVHHAHQHGILHRDLKPGNILFDAAGAPLVADFGLARLLDEDQTLTRTDAVLGTPAYLAPEQAAGRAGEITTAADIHALGAILYETLTGRPPFAGDNLPALLRQVAEAPPVPPRQINAAIPRDLETICLKCLEKEPAKRYVTAQELGNELDRFLRDEPIHARPVSRAERVLRWCRRKPALASAVFLILILLLIVIIGSPIATYRINKARQQAQANLEAQQREQYYANVRLSDLYIREGNTDRALDILLQCPPQYRNWEWGRLVYQCHQDFLTIPAHTNSPTLDSQFENHLRGLAFSADGSRLLTHGVDGLVKVWNAEDGRQLFAFGGTTNWITSYAWDRDARWLAVGCTNGVAHVFDTQTWREIRAVQHGTKGVRWLSLNSDGRKLSTAGDDGVVQIWDVDSGERQLRLSFLDEPLQNVHFDGGGERLVTKQASKVVVWDANSGAELSRIEPKERGPLTGPSSTLSPTGGEGRGEGVRSTSIVASSENRDGTLLVTFNADGEAKLWRADGTTVELGVVKGTQSGSLRWAALSEDNQLICTGGELGTARVWETATGKELFSIPNRVYGAQFSKDGSKLVTVGSENVARIWDVRTGREYLTLRGHGALVAQATFSPDGLRAATAGVNGIVKLWSASTGREVLRGDLWTWGPCYSQNGKRVASASSGLDLRVWDAESGEELLRFRPDMEDTMTAQFSPDGGFIATGGGEGVARLWDSGTGREVRAFKGHTRYIWELSFSPDGRRLATASYDQTARIWDVETGQQLHVLHGHSNRLWQVWFSPDGGRLATAGADMVGRVWDVQSGRLLFTLGSGSAPVMLLRFTPDGRRIFTSSREKNLRIWDASTGKLLATWPLRNAATWGFDFTPDGSRMVATLSENTTAGYDLPMVELWDVQNGRDLLSLRGHTEPVWQLFFRRDGRRILTSSGDSTTRQWEAFPWRESDYPGSQSIPLRERIAAYASEYWRERLRLETGAARKPAPPPFQPLVRWDRSRWPKRDERAGPNQIDLTEHFTGLLDVSFQPHVDMTFNNHLGAMRVGTVALSNVVFDIRGVIQLRRLEPLGGGFRLFWDRQPARADGIKIGQAFHRLHVLHAVSSESWSAPIVKDGTQVGSYMLHYRDGTQAELPILYGRHVRHWWTRSAELTEALKPLENGTVVWTGTNPAAQESGSTLRLYLSSYDNPRPDVDVVSTDYVSAMTQAAPFLVAMTSEP